MKLLFKQRLFSWFDSYDIYDEAGNTVYVVKGQFSWGHKLAIYEDEDKLPIGYKDVYVCEKCLRKHFIKY